MKRFVFWQILIAALLMAPDSQAQSLKDLLNKENIEKAPKTHVAKNTTVEVMKTRKGFFRHACRAGLHARVEFGPSVCGCEECKRGLLYFFLYFFVYQ